MSVIASAPGKLILSGEYAVLDGAPAVCMALDRRARVTVEAGDEDFCTISAPGFSATQGQFRAGPEGIEWLAGEKEFALVGHTWNAVGMSAAQPVSMTIDTREFVHDETGEKIGIGSSAAVAVALAMALCRLENLDADAGALANSAHRAFQGGLGSGADIACSSLGGLVYYRMNGFERRRIAWPDGLACGVVWVGVPASTREKLLRLKEQDTQVSGAALFLASQRIARAWAAGAVGQILAQYQDYNLVLREFSADHDLGIFDAGHAELTELAAESGAVYKPCGAGGGDAGIALARNPEAIDNFVRAATATGVYHLGVGLDADGPQIEEDSA